jgi:hypothetical protein
MGTIERIIEAVVNRLSPGGIAALTQRELEEIQAERVALAERSDRDKRQQAEELAVLQKVVERASAEEAKAAKAHVSATAKRVSAQRERQNCIAAGAAKRRTFEQEMRQRRSAHLNVLVGRVDILLEQAFGTTVFDYDRSVIPHQLITVVGDASDRRRALYTLRRAIDQEWQYLPLTDEEYEQRFASAVEGLPPIDTRRARQNAA